MFKITKFTTLDDIACQIKAFTSDNVAPAVPKRSIIEIRMVGPENGDWTSALLIMALS